MTSLRRLLLLNLGVFWLLLAVSPVQAEDVFPEPPELQADIQFWLDVFTRYGVDEGVLHDNRHLGVVYARLPMPASLSRTARNREVKKVRTRLKSTLRALATGKRANLSDEEARVLALWPADVSNATLQAAANRIRYQQGLKQRFRRGIERSGRWRAHVHDEFRKLNIPIEIAALPHVESSYNPAAVSHVGASGIWQFTRSTGRRFMRVDHVVDERNDPFIATRAAGQLLAYNYSLTGNWPMAITAYNHGLGGVRRAMRKFGDTAYVDILRRYDGRTFGFASRNFYVAFLAAKRVESDVETYFPGVVREAPVDYATVELDSYVAAAGLSRSLGVPLSTLQAHNPDLQSTVWQGSKHLPKGYALRLPTGATASPLAEKLAQLRQDVSFSSQLPDLFHTVSRGDTLSQIARTYRTRVSTLVALNNLRSSHSIRSGQRLRLPAAGPAPARVATAPATASPPVAVAAVPEAVAELSPIQAAATIDEDRSDVLLSDPSDYSVAENSTIEVHPFETLGHFGDWLDIKTQRLRDINGLAFRAQVELGQRIKLDLSQVDAQTFEARRVAYHRDLQDAYFREHVISATQSHTIQRGEAIWIVVLRRYEVPLWLFRQYNPEIDLHRVRPGTKVQIPIVATVNAAGVG